MAIVITTLAVAALLAPYAEVRSGQGLRRGLEEAELWSPNAESFLASPTHVHRALFSFVDTRDARTYLFPGVLPLLLALGALGWRRPEKGDVVGEGGSGLPALAERPLAGVLDAADARASASSPSSPSRPGASASALGGLDVSVRSPERVVVILGG